MGYISKERDGEYVLLSTLLMNMYSYQLIGRIETHTN